MGWWIFGKKKTETLPVREKMSANEKRFRQLGSGEKYLLKIIKWVFSFDSDIAKQYAVEAKYLNNMFQEGLLPVNFPEIVLEEFKNSVHYGNLVRDKADDVDFVEKVNTHRQNLKTLLDFNDDQVDEIVREIMQVYFQNQQFMFAYYLHYDHHVILDGESMAMLMERIYEMFIMKGDFSQANTLRRACLVDKIALNNNAPILIFRLFTQLHNLQCEFESLFCFQSHQVYKSLMDELQAVFADASQRGHLDLRGQLLALIASRIDCLLAVENFEAQYREKIPKEMWPQLALLHCQTLAQAKFQKGLQHVQEIERTVKQYEIGEAFRSWYRQQQGILNPVLIYRL